MDWNVETHVEDAYIDFHFDGNTMTINEAEQHTVNELF